MNGGKHRGTWVQNHLEVWDLLGSPALEHKCVCYTPGWCVTRGVPVVVLGGLIPWITLYKCPMYPVPMYPSRHTQDLRPGLQACGPIPS